MGTNGSVQIKDTASVNAWKARAYDLNEEAKKLIEHANKVLEDLSSMASGKFFNNVLAYADKVINGLTDIMRGFAQLLDVINDIMELGKRVIGGLVDGMTDLANKAFN